MSLLEIFRRKVKSTETEVISKISSYLCLIAIFLFCPEGFTRAEPPLSIAGCYTEQIKHVRVSTIKSSSAWFMCDHADDDLIVETRTCFICSVQLYLSPSIYNSWLRWPCPLPSDRAIPVLWQKLESNVQYCQTYLRNMMAKSCK